MHLNNKYIAIDNRSKPYILISNIDYLTIIVIIETT